MAHRFDVYAMCNPLFDLQAEVTDEFLATLPYDKGGMFLIDHQAQRNLVPEVYDAIVNTAPGGSGANTAFGVGLLGGDACYTGHVGDDEHGRLYREGMAKMGVKPNLGQSAGDTGLCLVLVTPDAQRTMFTYLGRCRNLAPADLNLEDLADSEFFYLTAYLWDSDSQKETVALALETAGQAGVKVALSLSDPFCVQRHRDDLAALIERHVHTLFGNYQEAQMLTDTETPEDAARVLSESCDVAVVTMDEKGSLIRAEGETHRIAPFPVRPVDTTGAGDMYAAGLLYGLARGWSYPEVGRLASVAAAKVVGHLGPRLPSMDDDIRAVLREFATA